MDDPLWYPDSGATHHVTKEPTIYSSKQPYHDTETVKMGNGSGLSIANIGSTYFSSSFTHKIFGFKKSFTCSFNYKEFPQCVFFCS